MAGEVLHDIAGHSQGSAVLEAGYGSLVEQLGLDVQEARPHAGDEGVRPEQPIDPAVGEALAGNGDEADVGRGVCRHVALDELERRETKVAQNLRGLLVFVLRACGGIAPRAPALPLSLRLWCGLDGKELLRVCLAILANLELEVEAGGWLTQADAEDLVNVGQKLLLPGTQVVRAHAALCLTAQDSCGPAQRTVQLAIHLCGVLGAGGLAHRVLGDKPPLPNDVHGKGVVAPIVQTVLEQVLDLPGVGGQIGGVDDALERGVGLLELVVEHAKGLGKLERVHIEEAHGLLTQHVEGREHPAATALALICDLTRLGDGDAVGIGVTAHARDIARGCHDIHGGHGVACDAIGALA